MDSIGRERGEKQASQRVSLVCAGSCTVSQTVADLLSSAAHLVPKRPPACVLHGMRSRQAYASTANGCIAATAQQ